jgi:hypothetical protein
MSQMTPREIVQELDKHIIGQSDAKRAVAIALRNRWRRMQVSDELRNEITPKNILMIGPTGVGKTEIARRLAQLANAPFIKVEATKFTEVGYVGKDVESIIRDLVDMSVKMTREQAMERVRSLAEDAAHDRILDILLPRAKNVGFANEPVASEEGQSATRAKMRRKLLDGELDEREIEFEVSTNVGVEIMTPPGMEEMASQLQGMFQSLGGGKKLMLVGSAVWTAAALYTHNFALFLLPAQGLLWLLHGSWSKRLLPALGMYAAVGLAYAPWIPTLRIQIANEDHYAWFLEFWNEFWTVQHLLASLRSFSPAGESVSFWGLRKFWNDWDTVLVFALAIPGVWTLWRTSGWQRARRALLAPKTTPPTFQPHSPFSHLSIP